MGVRQHDAEEIVAFFFEVGRVRQNEIDAGRRLFAAEGNADIDDDPLALLRRAVAVGVEVHANLARSAKRQEDEFVVWIGFHLPLPASGSGWGAG